MAGVGVGVSVGGRGVEVSVGMGVAVGTRVAVGTGVAVGGTNPENMLQAPIRTALMSKLIMIVFWLARILKILFAGI